MEKISRCYIGKKGRKILRHKKNRDHTARHAPLSSICNLAENAGACHSGITPVAQLAVNWAKSTTMSSVSLPLPLMVSAIQPSILCSHTYLLPTRFLSIPTEFCCPPLQASLFSFFSSLHLLLRHFL